MAKGKGTNEYQKLIRILLIVFVILALVVAFYFLIDGTIKEMEKQNLATAKEAQERIDADYDIALQEHNDLISSAKKNQVSEDKPWPQAKAEGWDVIDLTGYGVERAYDVNATREEMMLGGMMLVNRWHELPADYYGVVEPSLLRVDSANIPVKDGSVKMLPNALAALADMLKDAETEAQLTHFIIDEGYRTKEKQEQYYAEKESEYAANFEGEVLKQKTIAAGVNYPGTSEYQSGFSFNPRQYKRGDAEFNAPKFFETPHSDWMVENSWKYGFVFRFPVNEYPNETVGDKSFKTGESKKLMIYRYVGEGHAAAMKQLDMCMEEYVEYLMAHPHIAVYENGKLKYEITRVSYNNQPTATVEVSRNAAEYTVSMDNCGGVIVCMMYE
ncbi:MAG: D-alanyl-D-alanine carboxypeptidase family protein [Clostridia bacterium]|nr:D-alanyl-D-alanine carboxypeptidase family protein [Clostridia bacterium]MBR6753345.1 D-alanyl-D-alanine carboxypeptidase family protein [Clostridia bacterium]